MNVAQLLDQYSAYDLWANTRLVERLSQEPEAVLDAVVKSSFPSLRATLLHIRDAEHTWLCRLQGVKNNWPAEPDTSIATLLRHNALLRDHVRTLDEQHVERLCTYHDLRGNAHEQSAWQMLMHCFNHSSYHRGQVVTIMRQLGLDTIPALDLVVFQRTVGRS